MLRTGGKVLVDQLALHGAELAFCVPGESYLAVLDALYDAPIRLVTCRHEAAAANMAEAYGKLTGRPGICLVTRGPGATHASIGVHTAYQDSTPLILLIGQVGRDMLEREAFQEIDYRRMFNSMAKWVAQIESAERIPELLARAFSVATAGRPGPVVLALPEDMLVDEVDVADPGPYRPVHTHPGRDELERLRELLDGCERPLVIVGGGKWNAQAAEDMVAFCEANELPVATSFRRQDYVDNGSHVFVGHVGVGIDPALATRVTEADLLLVVGPRLGEMTTGGYTLVEPPLPKQTLVHVHAGAEELGRVYQPTLAIHAGSPEFAAAARGLSVSETQGSARRAWVEAARADHLTTLEPVASPGALNLSEVMAVLRERLPADAIICNGAGNFATWPHRFWPFTRFRTQLAPTSGAMGYGVPAAIAAKIIHPDRTVVGFVGDGDFLMSGQELATAVQERAEVLFLVVDNGMFGTIRMHQEREYPGRVIGTSLTNPDFAAFAASFGVHAARVERTEEFAPALEQALAVGGPALLHLLVDPEAITPHTTLTAVREGTAARERTETV
ncbi:MAG TPA: thiamine pyrophosphate-binding protein [Gaiellaceae bacterium]|nr:thiamine pyrophosphate-binding protein [Gaiellaceae bacterium]